MKKILVFSFLAFSYFVTQAQSPVIINDPLVKKISSPSDIFTDIQAEADAYYIPIRASNGGEPIHDEKVFRRWEYITKSRCIYPGAPVGGSVSGADGYMRLANGYNVCNSGPAFSPWTSIGQDPISGDHQSIGIIISLAVDPVNNNIIYAGSNAAGLWKTTDGGNNWSNITDNLGIASLGVASVVIDPFNSSNILAGTGTRSYGWSWINPAGIGILKSTDGGSTWTTTSLASFPGDFLDIEVIKFHPTIPDLVYAAGNKKIYKSTDGGTNWSVIFTNPNTEAVGFIDLEFNNLNSNIMYASTNWSGAVQVGAGAEFFTSTDGGTIWNNYTPTNNIVLGTVDTPICPDSSAAGAIAIDISPADPSNVYISFNDGGAENSFHYVMKSTDNGITWSIVCQMPVTHSVYGGKCYAYLPIDGFGWYKHEFEVSNASSNVMYLGGNTVYKTSDSGASWSSISQYFPTSPGATSTHADIRAMVQLPLLGNDYLVIGNDGGVAKTTNSGTSWTNINGNGLIITQFYSFSSFDQTENLVGGTQDNGTKFKNGASNTWLSFVLSGDGGWSEVDYKNENIVFATIYDHIKKSTTGGSGGYVDINNPGASYILGRKFHLDPSNHDKLWWGANDLYVYDVPSNLWTLKYNSPYNDDISNIDVAPSNGNIVYLSYWGPTWGGTLQNKLFKTTDGGTTWTDISSNFTAYYWSYITDMAVDPYNPNRVWASCAGFWQDGSDSTKGVNRILFTSDGGNTWTDASTGLPPFPVNYLAYQNGTDDVVFAGTDAGVYMWNKVTSEWECFNNNLPAVIVSKIEINNCKNKIMISTFGRGIWEAPLPDAAQFHVTTSQTWDALYDRDFTTDVVVDPNVILTIKGKVSFAAGKRLIISKKAKVVLDGGTLTNGCNGMWEGVQIDGDNFQTQAISGGLATYQGMLDMKKNGTTRPQISNAHNGVTLGITDPFGTFFWNTFGGIITARDADFLNNKRDVQFMLYPTYNNKSYFNNCLFEVNTTLNGGTLPGDRVSMWNVKNINFRGCDFKYTAGGAYPVGNRGHGIFSIDAKYNVSDYCSSFFYPCPPASIKQSTFEGFDYGIESSTSNPLLNATVNHAKFLNNNFWGANFIGMHYPIFNSCFVDVGGEIESCGLFLDNCKYYKIQNNDFTTTHAGYAGIISHNSKIGVHEIYRNNFANLIAGIAPENNNSGDSNFVDGLKLNCNTFTNNLYDIAQMSDGITPSSVAFVQGLITTGSTANLSLVRNYYTAICGGENKWYVDGSSKSIIHGCHPGGNTAPTPQPSCSDLLTNISLSTLSYNYISDCPNQLNKTIFQVKSSLKTAKDDLTMLKNNYINIVDSGNTQSLLNSINSTILPSDLKNLLMSKSPYLSDEVLIAYLEKTQTPPFGHIKEVVIANSPVTQDVKQVIDDISLPNVIGKEINDVQVGISERFKLEGEIILKENEIQSLISEEISYYLNDTINPNIDSVIYILKTENRPHSSCDLVRAYMYKEDYVTAVQILDTLELAPDHNDFCLFQRLILQLNQASEKCYIMKTDAGLKSQVEAIAMDNTKESQCSAQALLTQVFEYDYPILFLYPYQPSSYHMMQIVNKDSLNYRTPTEFEFTAFPNPAIDNINFIFKADENSVAKIEITDITGRVIETISISGNTIKTYSTIHLNDAIYLATLFVNDKQIDHRKIVITK